MVFSSLLFICVFLPLAIILYFLIPSRFRNGFLLVSSLVFYAWGEPKYVAIMLFSTVFDYTNGILLEFFDKRNKNGARIAVLVASLVVNLGILGYFKYYDFFIDNFNRAFGADIPLLRLTLPVGISFYTFQTLSYTIDVYRRKIVSQHNIISFGAYISMFPQLIAGPIVRYCDIESRLNKRQESLEQVASGILRFCVGLGKKVIIANQAGALWDSIISSQPDELSALSAWLGALAFAIQIYFDFSGYSDMAIGLGRIFGFEFPENFNLPYISKSITDFWRRWHITLGTWFREYLYIPLGGNRKGKIRLYFNLFIVWLLTGFWHGAGWNFILWGLYFFVILVAEKTFVLKLLQKLPSAVSHIYAILLILAGWVIFACDDSSRILPYFRAMLGFNGGIDNTSLYYASSYSLLLVTGALFSTGIPEKICKKAASGLKASVGFRFTVKAAFGFALLVLSVALLTGDAYNPFLYFRF